MAEGAVFAEDDEVGAAAGGESSEAVVEAEHSRGVEGGERGDLFEGCGGEGVEVADGAIHGEGAAGYGAAALFVVGDALAIGDLDIEGAELVVAVLGMPVALIPSVMRMARSAPFAFQKRRTMEGRRGSRRR